MDTISKLPSRSIFEVLKPSFQAFYPLLAANASKIKSVARSTHSYGSHARQKCDVYQPSTKSDGSPILAFFYGGGLIRGDRALGPPMDAMDLIYANLGAFFALQGYTTVVGDYRRVNDRQMGTGEDATFPSGGDDMSALLTWLVDSSESPVYTAQKSTRDLFLMGNSAGGLHCATFMLYDKYLQQRQKLVKADSLLRWKGVVLLSVPCDQDTAAPGRKVVNEAYWPLTLNGSSVEVDTAAGHAEHSFGPAGLLRKLTGSRGELAIPAVLMAEDEFDPADEIADSIGRFEKLWEDKFGDGMDKLWVEGHNHISPPLALMSGEGEKWGHDVVEWMKKQSSIV